MSAAVNLAPDLLTQVHFGSLIQPDAPLARISLTRPNEAYCVSGKVNSADKLYLVIESVRLDTKHPGPSNLPVPVDGAGGSPM